MTRNKLAAGLREAAATASPESAAKYEAFAKRAEAGEFDDFASPHALPITQLIIELNRAGFTKFARRVANDEFSCEEDEGDEWVRSPEGQEIAIKLSPELRKLFGLKLND